MASATLVDVDVATGEEAYRALKADEKLGVRAAMWWYYASAEEWRLLVEVEAYEKHGARAAYSRIWKILERAKLLDKLSLTRVVAVPPNHRIPKALRKLSKIPGTGSIRGRLDGTWVSDVFVEGAYVYDL
ncbi:MAG: hypothetical protein HYS13_08460 [Planctomycetia bacterium]|nr:hypothetical protein [Planctomycetia bacterium]